MNILVTGGAGYIGSHTAQSLIFSGHKVIVYDNLSTGFMEAIPNGCEFVRGDILDQPILSRTMKQFQVDAVIHLAAKIIVPESVIKPMEYYENNVVGMLSLQKSCIENGVRFIVFSSTAVVYGMSEFGLLSESSKILPMSPYGWSKYMSEQMLRDAGVAYGLKSVILRYFNVAGGAIDGSNGQRTKKATHLIKLASETAVGKRPFVSIMGTDYPTDDGSGVRDYIHVLDLADLHVKALSYLEAGGDTDVFNCGYGQGYSVREVLGAMQRVCAKEGVNPFRINEEGRRLGDPARLVSDSKKIQAAFGWKPQYADIELICRTAYLWEKKNKASF